MLTDIHMPVMNGEALLAVTRERYPALPVIAFSAVTRNEQEDDWLRRGFHGYLGKPASLRELETCLGTVMASAGPGREPGPGPGPEAEAGPEAGAEAGPEPKAGLAAIPGPGHDHEREYEPAVLSLSSTQRRYRDLLHRHLQTDLPELENILSARDVGALRDWAHRAAGGFRIVLQAALVQQCRAVESRCETQPGWGEDVAALAPALYEMFRAYAATAAPADPEHEAH